MVCLALNRNRILPKRRGDEHEHAAFLAVADFRDRSYAPVPEVFYAQQAAHFRASQPRE